MLGRWSVPRMRTVSVPVSMFGPDVSAALADAGRLLSGVPELIRNSTSDSTSQKTIRPRRYRITRLTVNRSRQPRDP